MYRRGRGLRHWSAVFEDAVVADHQLMQVDHLKQWTIGHFANSLSSRGFDKEIKIVCT